ncbi:MAG: hypothetical protein ACRYFX_01870 [Janthinobacterium lividum]
MKARKPDFGRKLQAPVPSLDQTDALLYGLPTAPAPPAARAQPVVPATPAAAPPPATAEDELVEVSFTTLIRKQTFLRLKQAEFWKPGFMIKKATDKALSDFLDALPEANQELPAEEKHRLNLKKLK